MSSDSLRLKRPAEAETLNFVTNELTCSTEFAVSNNVDRLVIDARPLLGMGDSLDPLGWKCLGRDLVMDALLLDTGIKLSSSDGVVVIMLP